MADLKANMLLTVASVVFTLAATRISAYPRCVGRSSPCCPSAW
jgi:hypothetical protein